jgi:DNA helicase-4
MQLRAKGITKWWQKLLGSTAIVELDSTLISIQTKREAFRLPLNNIEKFDIKKGWLSTKLVIHCVGNPAVVLKGYTNKQLNDFKAQFIQSLLTLVAASQRWKEFELSLEHLKNRDVYLSSYEWQPIAELHKLATKFNKLGVEPSHVKDKAYQKTLQQAQRLTDESVGELCVIS